MSSSVRLKRLWSWRWTICGSLLHERDGTDRPDNSKDRLACAGARERGICANRITIRRDEVERRVLAAMQERLWDDELYEEFCREFTRERNRPDLAGWSTVA